MARYHTRIVSLGTAITYQSHLCKEEEMVIGTDKDNEDLTPNHDAVDANEEPVLVHTFEDIKFVVKPSVVEFVEDLHPHKCVEGHCVQLVPEFRIGFEVIGEYLFAGEVENKGDDC
jgi:hypothetical protein